MNFIRLRLALLFGRRAFVFLQRVIKIMRYPSLLNGYSEAFLSAAYSKQSLRMSPSRFYSRAGVK